MTRPGRLFRWSFLALGGVSALLLMDVRGWTYSAPPAPAEPQLERSEIPSRKATDAAIETTLSDLSPVALSPVLGEAAAALRRRDCDRASALLEPLAAGDATGDRAAAAEASFARVVQGLYAHACERVERARELLAPQGARGTSLEDWRLLTLADAATALDDEPLARAALDEVLRAHRTSPLHARALEKAAVTARDAGDLGRALELAERAASPREAAGGELPRETRSRLDVLVWEIGEELGDARIRRRAARRLLIRDPGKADELRVARVFETGNGEVPWGAVLSPDGLTSRGRALAEAGRHDEALEVLEAIPPERRDSEWKLLAAAVLTGARRGDEALAILDGIVADAVDGKGPEPRDRALASRVEWRRALAARDLATAWRGRRNLPAAERERWRRTSLRHFVRVPELDGDRELSLAALRRLFLDLADTELEPALRVLRRLQELDPDDTTGADFLWRRGWEEFQGRNRSTAIGYWAELSSLYPHHRNSRSGRYWTGRAFESLGHWERARELYREVAEADTTDFYRKYALERLARDPARGPGPDAPPVSPGRVPSREPEPWPEDPRLARARLLTDLGLDDLALAELEGIRRRAETATAGLDAGFETGLDLRAADALESEILHRKGDLRASIGPIRRAFPALGGPYQAAVPERALRLYYPLAYGDEIRAQARAFDLPVDVLYGMIRQESGFDPGARSRAGARGLLQLMPATAREVAHRIGLRYSSRRLHDPSFNVRLGAAYFRQVLGMFDDHLELALAGYNGGPYRIKRLWQRAGHRDIDRFLEGLQVTESRIYVKRILVLSDSYRRLYGPSPGPRVATTAPAAPGPTAPSPAAWVEAALRVGP